MKTFLRFVLLFLILVSVAMVSALTAMRFAIHGREVAVPKLVGLTRAAAEQQASANGLILDVEDHFYSPDVAEGKVISQSPAPGTQVRRGWKVRVAESLGPQKSEVPDLVGQSVRAAEINVHQRGLEVDSVAVADLPGAAPDEIVAQSPPPNSGPAASPKISVLVAGPEKEQRYVMPDFVGKHIGDVQPQIEDAGFKVLTHDPGCAEQVQNKVPQNNAQNNVALNTANQKAAPCDKESGIIAKQSPAPGQRIVTGSNILFELIH